VVQELVQGFEREHPGVRVRVQQIPWTAAHEKLLTAFVGRVPPDVAQLGNTWIPEFAALGALEPLESRRAGSAELPRDAFFPGIWDPNVIGDTLLGIPWYVDTRVLFYRKDLLRQAGVGRPPETWDEWRAAMVALKRRGRDRYPMLLPLSEWQPLIILGMQTGSPLVDVDRAESAFGEARFRRAFDFYLDLFRSELAPGVGAVQLGNIYQEFARGYFAMYITGPWNVAEFKHRLPADLQSAWATAPLPGPDGPASGYSVAWGSSLVIFRRSRQNDTAWRLIEYLSRPAQQLRFMRLSGDLPARREAWRDSTLAGEPAFAAFRTQLDRVRSTPKVPEWEQIATAAMDQAERAVRGQASADRVLADLDRQVNAILEKRRWLIQRRVAQR